jgi:hypothetical protein
MLRVTRGHLWPERHYKFAGHCHVHGNVRAVGWQDLSEAWCRCAARRGGGAALVAALLCCGGGAVLVVAALWRGAGSSLGPRLSGSGLNRGAAARHGH